MKNTSQQILIGLGSNLDAPICQINNAINSIQTIQTTSLVKQSSFYESLPQGPQDQGNFINSVILVESALSAPSLLAQLKNIEQLQGRIKTRHWGERCIDLDILFYGQSEIQIQQPDLTIPHPQALLRDFVVIPALEIVPDWKLPDGTTLNRYRGQCLQHQLRKIQAKSP